MCGGCREHAGSGCYRCLGCGICVQAPWSCRRCKHGQQLCEECRRLHRCTWSYQAEAGLSSATPQCAVRGPEYRASPDVGDATEPAGQGSRQCLGCGIGVQAPWSCRRCKHGRQLCGECRPLHRCTGPLQSEAGRPPGAWRVDRAPATEGPHVTPPSEVSHIAASSRPPNEFCHSCCRIVRCQAQQTCPVCGIDHAMRAVADDHRHRSQHAEAGLSTTSTPLAATDLECPGEASPDVGTAT